MTEKCKFNEIIRLVFLVCILLSTELLHAINFSDNTYVVAKIDSTNFNNNSIWSVLQQTPWTSAEIKLHQKGRDIVLAGSDVHLNIILSKLEAVLKSNDSRILPVFFNFNGNVELLDSIIRESAVSSVLFYLPQGETWPSNEYLVQANRRLILFLNGEARGESKLTHRGNDYYLQITASRITPKSTILKKESNINKELFKINNLHRLPTGNNPQNMKPNLVPDYINFLLDSWTQFGKKPNFVEVGPYLRQFVFISGQLNSFKSIKGIIRTSSKILDRVYWKNPDILISGGKFSFPVKGGEEIILSPYAPGYQMLPSQLIVTHEMALPEYYSITASPLPLREGLKAGFYFDGTLTNIVHPEKIYTGENFSFSEDIERGTVLRLPENSHIVLGDPNEYGLPNSSFTVSCFVKFTDILEFGDNAVLGNEEQGYRRGLHLVLRSGHPYFGLWANDYMSDEVLDNNVWYHLTWRYIIETGEQSIYVNGKYVGGSDGHPPYSGTSELRIGSALSGGASLRGYIDNLFIWNRPLGDEEINRLFLDEKIPLETPNENQTSQPFTPLWIGLTGTILLLLVLLLIKKQRNSQPAVKTISVQEKNKILLFGEFMAINQRGENISKLFTPKIRELFIFIVIHSLRNDAGAKVEDIDQTLWFGLEKRKVANNRAVTLNKLRKLLAQFETVEIISDKGYLRFSHQGKFFCDYIEVFKLCHLPNGMNKDDLELFYHLTKRGSLLKNTDWPWLDDIRGYIGNQVIDNLLKLASEYTQEKKFKAVEKLAQRILDYDELNEEAVFLQVYAQQHSGNQHLAQYTFSSFCSRYRESMGEPFNMDYQEFIETYSYLAHK